MNCIDLRTLAGNRYRLEYDASHSGRADDPWLLIIPCQRAHIYPHGAKLLGVATDARGSTAKAIARIPGVTVVQDGDDGINAVFPVELFPHVAKLVKPRRKRRLTPKQRATNGRRLAKFAFSSARQSDSEALETTLAS